MLLKIFGVGELHGEKNQDRIVSAFTTLAEDIPVLSLLLKDHKKVKEGALPATRPVIGISSTMAARMARILSEIIKRIADVTKGSNEMKSREHLQATVEITNAALLEEAEKAAYGSAYESGSDDEEDNDEWRDNGEGSVGQTPEVLVHPPAPGTGVLMQNKVFYNFFFSY